MMNSTYQSIYNNFSSNKHKAQKRTNQVRAKRRMIVLIALFLGLCLTFSGIVQAWSGDKSSSEGTNHSSAQVERIYIVSGDTLWDIARSYMPQNGEYDIRAYISLIKKHNDMSSSELQVGDVIEVPILTTS